jgi:hypothetical protein
MGSLEPRSTSISGKERSAPALAAYSGGFLWGSHAPSHGLWEASPTRGSRPPPTPTHEIRGSLPLPAKWCKVRAATRRPHRRRPAERLRRRGAGGDHEGWHRTRRFLCSLQRMPAKLAHGRSSPACSISRLTRQWMVWSRTRPYLGRPPLRRWCPLAPSTIGEFISTSSARRPCVRAPVTVSVGIRGWQPRALKRIRWVPLSKLGS